MIKAGELRPGSCYIFDEKVIRYKYGFKEDLSYWQGYLLNLDPIPFTDELFHNIRHLLRPLFDQSAELGANVRVYRFEEDRYYQMDVDKTKILEIRNLHELQNMLYDLYDEELEILDKWLVIRK